MKSDRLEKIVLLLSSDQPGEVFAAAQAIGRTLPGLGLDWHSFAAAVRLQLSGSAPPPPREPPGRTYYQPPPPPPAPAAGLVTDKLVAIMRGLWRKREGMKPNVRLFVVNLRNRYRVEKRSMVLTSSQLDTLLKLAQQFGVRV